MIAPETIQEIKETVKVVEVINDFVTLKKRGVNFIGLCPFHNEKTPSFTVSAAKGIYKCFGCGKAGNAIKFLMEHEHYNYPEALRYLADKYNIEIEEKEQTQEDIQALNEKESQFHVSTFAQKYFSQQLFETEEGKAIGLAYFKEREFSEETIKKFQLGYSPDKWDAFTEHALKNGYKKEYIEKAGLSIFKNDKSYDRFRARVIFPIQNLSGRVIGFGARILKSETNKPKYVNSPESDIYNKSKVLYGLHYSKNAIVSKDVCFLVEGYTDVISLHQAGIENVVASSGTSLTTDQIRLIKRYTTNITILYDGDEAGIKASFRGIDMILEQGMNVKIVIFPAGEDPDSFARNNRKAEVEEFITIKANNFITFKTKLLRDEAKNDPVKKAGLIKEIISTISLIPDGITRSVYVKECSTIVEVAEQTLMNELNKLLRKRYYQKNQEKDEIPPAVESQTSFHSLDQQIEIVSNGSEYQEQDIIRLLLNYGDKEIVFVQLNEDKQKIEIKVKIAEFIVNDLLKDNIQFTKSNYQQIFDEYATAVRNKNIPDDQYFINHHDENIAKLTIDLISTPYTLSKNWEIKHKIFINTESHKLKHTVVTSVLSFKLRKIEQMIHKNELEIKAAVNNENILALLEKEKKLLEAKVLISSNLGRIITK